MTAEVERYGEYSERGDYHREIDPKWRYYPVYKAKMQYIRGFLENTPPENKTLDAGCGEGLLVEEYREKGYNITGLDLGYSSNHVKKGDVRDMPFGEGEFSLVLCLDVIEHLNYEDQGRALGEMHRVLDDGGLMLLAIPNLAHIASRLAFLFTGKLIRTSTIERHKGDRPINEYLQLLEDAGFHIKKRRGVFPTLPVLSALTYIMPDKVYPIHQVYNRILAYPNWCFLNLILCRKK
ncbi:MAG: methyltransferase domain-containing protein [Candidatus Altiarchaeota archaeon]|nr:methyltransferase domain-containing protein [Candidatus Altiarchaeota archaeon]